MLSQENIQNTLGESTRSLAFLEKEKISKDDITNLIKSVKMLTKKYTPLAIQALGTHNILNGEINHNNAPGSKKINILGQKLSNEEYKAMEKHLKENEVSFLSELNKARLGIDLNEKVKKELKGFFGNIYQIIMNEPYEKNKLA